MAPMFPGHWAPKQYAGISTRLLCYFFRNIMIYDTIYDTIYDNYTIC